MKHRNHFVYLVSIVLCFTLLLGASGLSSLLYQKTNQTKSVFSQTQTEKGYFQPVVLDGKTNAPIQGANVIVAETNQVFQTDSNGQTKQIAVPILRDTRFDAMLPKPWGEITLIVQKDGYLPYALFYLEVQKDEIRNGPTILLFQASDAASDEAFSIIEGPNREWVDTLIEKYLSS